MSPFLRRFFYFFNKYFMVPLFRLGMGPFFGNPFTGYIMVLKLMGRKTGRIRYTPVNYAFRNGNVYCISGAGKSSDWYHNLLANPAIEVILPTQAISGHVEEVTDLIERHLVIRPILKNAGFAGFLEGYNPYTISDDELVRKTSGLPVLRIRPNGIGNGPSDPGGWVWMWIPIVIVLIILILVAMIG